MGEGVSSLLRRSLGHLKSEVPDSYRLLLDRLGPLVVALNVDAEHFSLSGGDRLEVTDGAVSAHATIATSRTAILEVLDGRLGLQEAVETGTVCIRGSLDDLLRAHDTLLAYVHAAVRAQSHPELLSALRTGSS